LQRVRQVARAAAAPGCAPLLARGERICGMRGACSRWLPRTHAGEDQPPGRCRRKTAGHCDLCRHGRARHQGPTQVKGNGCTSADRARERRAGTGESGLMTNDALDVLAIAAHRDDVEQTCGGTLLKMAEQGKKTGILDLTRGEMGTRGSAEERA